MTEGLTATRREDADRSAKCYLMDMPGEIRNRIYSYARDDGPFTYFPRRLKQYSDDELQAYGVDNRVPGFLGLRQACRQLRQEYSPIHAAHTKVHVCHMDLEEFVRLGFPYLCRDSHGKLMGIVFLDWKSININREKEWEWEKRINILPFLAYCRDNPELRVQCAIHGCPCHSCQLNWSETKPGLDNLFKIANNPSLQKWLDESVSAIILQFEVGVDFIVKEGQGQDWMKAGTTEKVSRWNEFMASINLSFTPDTLAFRQLPI